MSHTADPGRVFQQLSGLPPMVQVRTVAFLLVAVLTAVWPARAAACGACLCDSDPRFFFPASGALPTNGKIFVHAPGLAPEAVTLERRPDGAPLPFSREEGPVEGSFWVVPQALEPGSEVRVRMGEALAVDYTVLEEVDLTAPEAPELSGGPPPVGYCVGGRAARIDQVPTGAPLLLRLSVETTEGTRVRMMHSGGQSTGALVIGALSGCLGVGELETADTTVRVRAQRFDAAGNASPEGPAVTVSLEPVVTGTCGNPGFWPSCSVVSGGPLLLAVSLLGLLRRSVR